jgi:hypothetical protein
MKSFIYPYCNHCQRAGHWTSKCQRIPGNKCHNCGKLEHWARECKKKKKDRNKDNNKGKRNGNGKAGEQLNVTEEVLCLTSKKNYTTSIPLTPHVILERMMTD